MRYDDVDKGLCERLEEEIGEMSEAETLGGEHEDWSSRKRAVEFSCKTIFITSRKADNLHHNDNRKGRIMEKFVLKGCPTPENPVWISINHLAGLLAEFIGDVPKALAEREELGPEIPLLDHDMKKALAVTMLKNLCEGYEASPEGFAKFLEDTNQTENNYDGCYETWRFVNFP